MREPFLPPDVTCERIHDEDAIATTLYHPDIWPLIRQDGPLFVLNPTDHWYLFQKGNDWLGMVCLSHRSNHCLSIHPMIFRAHRRKYAYAIVFECLRMYQDYKIVAEIPQYRRELLNFAMKCGFTVEGLNRESLVKDGIIMNTIQLGITSREICSLFQEEAA